MLMRPEHQYAGEVGYPYPPWIVEIPWVRDLMHHATLPWSNREVLQAMADRDVVFVNDYGIALTPWLPRTALRVCLSSGSDIDMLCRWQIARSFAAGVRRKWLYPVRLALELWRTRLQRRGLERCDIVSYFPRGLNPLGDEVIDHLAQQPRPPELIERYDANFQAVGVRRVAIPRRALRKILVPVRIHLLPPEGGEFEYKGNDLILRALARYRQRNPEVEFHLFEKGPPADLALARRIIDELGLGPAIVWHRPTNLPGLLQLYEDGDVVVDQVGTHWMGGVGFYALYMGRPVIANARLDVFGPLWGTDPPILNAGTVDEIHDHLVRCEDFEFRARLADAAHAFARDVLDTEAVYRRLRDAVLEQWGARTDDPLRRLSPQ
ncbi:MAG: glycosyltransferase [Rubrivivax sp.]